MGPELVALATAAATSLVGAMATDAWQAVRDRVAKLLGRGDERREQIAQETLDDDAAAIATRSDDPAVARDISARWALRLEDLLRLDPEAIDALRQLVKDAPRSSTVVAEGHGLAAGGDVRISATSGGVAAGTLHGSVSTQSPPSPGTTHA